MCIFLQCVFFATISVMNVGGKTSLKRRLGVLEQRMNVMEVRMNTDNEKTISLEQDIEALNTSLVYTKDQVCSNKMKKGDGQEVKSHSDRVIDIHRFSKARVSVDFANEKKWLREKMVVFENVIQEQGQLINISISEIRSNLRSHEQAVNTKVVDGLQTNFNTMNASMINIVKDIGSNMSSLSSEIVDIKDKVVAVENEINEQEVRIDSHKQAIHNILNVQSAEIKDKLQTKFNMINASMISMKKDIESNMSSLSSEIADIKDIVNAEIQEIYTPLLQKLSAEIQEKDKLINEQRLEIGNLKQSVDQMSGFLLPCPTGWTKFKSYCYLYVKDRMPYYTARERCSSQGASVADIQSKGENDFIVKLCTDSGQKFVNTLDTVWIGITDEVTENVWISDRTGKQATYTRRTRTMVQEE
ncbi:C-type lectin domain family 4 member F-like isoform X2 [Mercenaria mercenaria]|uniref:C-type lectin domain family 4 member F-like isoform X2 n=1 Tax=Mercenaria mercenaria TaxID=6596 RepID=UPI00234F6F2C|nr:C-type lectin domain family 4 member F-like isoform X2 [Mercenaria mercenaria]